MFNSVWAFLGIIIVVSVVSVVADAVVKIVRTSKSGAGSKAFAQRIDDLEADVADLEQDLEDARERIIVLEKIVTDSKFDLGKQIDDLASGAD